MKSSHSNYRKIVDFIIGFISTPVFQFIVARAIVFVINKLNPDLWNAWDQGSLATKLVIGSPGLVIPIFCAVYLWRSRRFISMGILAYLVFDLLVGLFEILITF